MNKIFKWSFAILAVMTVGCTEDLDQGKEPIRPAYSGDDVVFTFAGQDPNSRTTYAEPWAESGNQQINWGNYITSEQEFIKIYCRETDGSVATYQVNPAATGSSVAIDINKAEENVSLKWGAQGKQYEFYSFYPAAKASNALIGETGHVISATF